MIYKMYGLLIRKTGLWKSTVVKWNMICQWRVKPMLRNFSLLVQRINYSASAHGVIKQCCDPSVCPSICLSHAPSSTWRTLGLRLLGNTNRKPPARNWPQWCPKRLGESFCCHLGDALLLVYFWWFRRKNSKMQLFKFAACLSLVVFNS